jgi:tetratricopeptide (TPR) repeat protein
MLQLARGEPDAAMRCLERALVERNWAHSEKRGALLADLVIVAAAAGRPDRARAALAELESHPDLWSGTAVEAMVMRARGELALLGESPAEAVRHLREAVNLWRRIGSPVHAAVAQLRLGEALHATDDHAAAALETGAARAALERLGAAAVTQTARHPV